MAPRVRQRALWRPKYLRLIRWRWRRTRIAAVATLALINVFTLAAGITVARMLPSRLAALKVPTVAAGQVQSGGTVLSSGAGGGSGSLETGVLIATKATVSASASGNPRASSNSMRYHPSWPAPPEAR